MLGGDFGAFVLQPTGFAGTCAAGLATVDRGGLVKQAVARELLLFMAGDQANFIVLAADLTACFQNSRIKSEPRSGAPRQK